MQHEAMLNELMELILSGDPVESDIHQLYAGLQPHLQALADWLHVAKLLYQEKRPIPSKGLQRFFSPLSHGG